MIDSFRLEIAIASPSFASLVLVQKLSHLGLFCHFIKEKIGLNLQIFEIVRPFLPAFSLSIFCFFSDEEILDSERPPPPPFDKNFF